MEEYERRSTRHHHTRLLELRGKNSSSKLYTVRPGVMRMHVLRRVTPGTHHTDIIRTTRTLLRTTRTPGRAWSVPSANRIVLYWYILFLFFFYLFIGVPYIQRIVHTAGNVKVTLDTRANCGSLYTGIQNELFCVLHTNWVFCLLL